MTIVIDEETTYIVHREQGFFECVYEGCEYQHQVPKVFTRHVRKCNGPPNAVEQEPAAPPAGVVAVVAMESDITGQSLSI